ncbi:MAG: cytochrome b [Gammaproteobacteria bacterium]|nr:cytochrome b [Gammaproteobacteria bacterium]
MDTQQKLSNVTVSLHWIVGLTIITLLVVGIYMEENEVFSLYPIHKSVGMLIFLLIIGRVVWRLKNGWPEPASQYKAIEHKLAKLTHWVLIVGTLAMPLSGMVMSGVGGHGLNVFGFFELMPMNPDPNEVGAVIAHNESIAKLGHEVHELFGIIMIVAILLHMAGAFKHHIVDKDGTLRRMLGAHI